MMLKCYKCGHVSEYMEPVPHHTEDRVRCINKAMCSKRAKARKLWKGKKK